MAKGYELSLPCETNCKIIRAALLPSHLNSKPIYELQRKLYQATLEDKPSDTARLVVKGLHAYNHNRNSARLYQAEVKSNTPNLSEVVDDLESRLANFDDSVRALESIKKIVNWGLACTGPTVSRTEHIPTPSGGKTLLQLNCGYKPARAAYLEAEQQGLLPMWPLAYQTDFGLIVANDVAEAYRYKVRQSA